MCFSSYMDRYLTRGEGVPWREGWGGVGLETPEPSPGYGPVVLSYFIGNASSGGATLVHGKENEV